MIRGRCSACGATAERAPSGQWWHVGARPCPNRSWTLYRPFVVDDDGLMRATTPAERPAHFEEVPA